MDQRPAITRLPRREAPLLLACVLLAAIFGRHHVTNERDGAAAPDAGISPEGHAYFGGQPARGLGTRLDLAAGAPACLAARPPAGMNGEDPGEIAADLPGLYGAPWVGSFNGQLIAALHVTVARNPGWPPVSPVLQIYRRGARQPVFSQAVPVSVSRGSQALLYRMFVDGPIRCIDLVIPNGAGAGTAYVYYPFHGRLFEAEGRFAVQR